MVLRRWLFVFVCAGLWSPLASAAPRPLEEALQKVEEHRDRWAFTQTFVERDGKGAVRETIVVRFDPSKPYAEQFTPISVDGGPPTPAVIRRYRKEGERRAEMIENPENAKRRSKRPTLGELMDIERAVLSSEDEQRWIYDVPLREQDNRRLPPEKFQVLAEVSKISRAFAQIEVTLRSSMRAGVVGKIKTAAGKLQFAEVAPDFPPTLTRIEGGGVGSVVFVKIGRRYEISRSDFARVTPYCDRFEVKLGPLQTIDF